MKYIVEFIGTFFLVLTVGLCVMGGVGSFAPIAIGCILMVMVYAGGHISGAHYNPAVTLAVFMRGKCSAADVPVYMIVQIIAGVLGALTAGFLIPEGVEKFFAENPTTSLNIGPSLIAEFLGTFALCWVVLNTATSKDHPNNSFYGLAIGFTVLACAYALGGISGGAFNPAVAAGITTAGIKFPADIWVFLVGEFAAAALAAILFRVTNPHDND